MAIIIHFKQIFFFDKKMRKNDMSLVSASTITSDFCVTTLSKDLDTINRYLKSYENRSNAFSPQQ